MKQRNKRKNVMKDVGDSKAGQLEDAAASVDTSDCDFMSDCGGMSHTMSNSQGKELYPPTMYECFLQQTKYIKGLDLEKYFMTSSFLFNWRAT